jgi:hypothetical protein
MRIGRRGIGEPAFLNDRQLFYVTSPAGGCGGGPQTPLIYNLVSGVESPSMIDSVGDTWPATSTLR